MYYCRDANPLLAPHFCFGITRSQCAFKCKGYKVMCTVGSYLGGHSGRYSPGVYFDAVVSRTLSRNVHFQVSEQPPPHTLTLSVQPSILPQPPQNQPPITAGVRNSVPHADRSAEYTPTDRQSTYRPIGSTYRSCCTVWTMDLSSCVRSSENPSICIDRFLARAYGSRRGFVIEETGKPVPPPPPPPAKEKASRNMTTRFQHCYY